MEQQDQHRGDDGGATPLEIAPDSLGRRLRHRREDPLLDSRPAAMVETETGIQSIAGATVSVPAVQPRPSEA